MTDHFYHLAALPSLDPPGAVPPLSLSEFADSVPAGSARDRVWLLLLGEDLLLRESVLAGAVPEPVPAVLSTAQCRGEESLPIDVPEAEMFAIPGDAIWAAYYAHAARAAERLHSPFLAAWVALEVGVRNELVRLRARALAVPPAPYLVANGVEKTGSDVDAAVAGWQEAPDPLTGANALILARWRWIDQWEPAFTFCADEYVAYAARLALLHRWQRLNERQAAGVHP